MCTAHVQNIFYWCHSISIPSIKFLGTLQIALNQHATVIPNLHPTSESYQDKPSNPCPHVLSYWTLSPSSKKEHDGTCTLYTSRLSTLTLYASDEPDVWELSRIIENWVVSMQRIKYHVPSFWNVSTNGRSRGTIAVKGMLQTLLSCTTHLHALTSNIDLYRAHEIYLLTCDNCHLPETS